MTTCDPDPERTGGYDTTANDTTQPSEDARTDAARGSEQAREGAPAADSEEAQRREWAKRVVDALPPLTEEQRERLALLLRTHR